MLSPLAFALPSQLACHSRLFRGLLIGTALSTGLLLAGCDKATNQIDPETQFVVLDNKVIVDHNLIHTSIPERYQPSFNLEGTLVPALSTDVEMPYTLISGVLMVKEGDEVTKDQILAKLDAKVAESEVQNLASEMVDVYVDGVKIEPKKTKKTVQEAVSTQLSQLTHKAQSQSEQAASNNKNQSDKNNKRNENTNNKNNAETEATSNNTKSNPTSDSQPTHSEPLINVSLVIKSPIAGEIISIKNKDQLSAQSANTSDKPDPASGDTTSQAEAKASTMSSEKSTNSKKSTQSGTTENAVSYPVIHIDSTHDLQLIGNLPLTTQSQLSVGRSVSFTVHDLQTEFAGQISHIIPDPESDTLTVRASLIPGEHQSSDLLEPGMSASMRIEYGQIELGVRLPRQAIHEAALDNLSAKHTRPTSPINGYVWVVEQDQSLSYNPVQVVQYFADSDKFLVSGINNDSLVCLADLPTTAAGKILTVN